MPTEEIIQKNSPRFRLPAPPLPYGNFGLKIPKLLTTDLKEDEYGKSSAGWTIASDLNLYGNYQVGKVAGPFASIYMYGLYNTANVTFGATANDCGSFNTIYASGATANLNGFKTYVNADGSTVRLDGAQNSADLKNGSTVIVGGSNNTVTLASQSTGTFNGSYNYATLSGQSTGTFNGSYNRATLSGQSSVTFLGGNGHVDVTEGSAANLFGNNNEVSLFQQSYARLSGNNEKAHIYSPKALVFIETSGLIKVSNEDINSGSVNSIDVYVTRRNPVTVLDIRDVSKGIIVKVHEDVFGAIPILAYSGQVFEFDIDPFADPVARKVDALLQGIASSAIPGSSANAQGVYVAYSSSYPFGAVTVSTSSPP